MMGTIYFIDAWGREGKTLFKKLDKNLSRKSSELIFFLAIAQTILICLVFIAEFWWKDFSKQFSTIMGIFIMTMAFLVIILMIVERTFKEVDVIATSKDKIKKCHKVIIV